MTLALTRDPITANVLPKILNDVEPTRVAGCSKNLSNVLFVWAISKSSHIQEMGFLRNSTLEKLSPFGDQERRRH
jgi:hypothetical protein